MNDILVSEKICTAFAGGRRVAAGTILEVATRLKALLDAGEQETVLIFDDATSRVVEIDFRGTPDDVRARLAPPEETRRGPGRPKLGVVAREVTLLPRHWEWLSSQPGGASVALRKLVDEARKANQGRERVRLSQEAAYRFMSAMAGDQAGFEEATRALFAAQRERFEAETATWPADIRAYALQLAGCALAQPDPEASSAG